MRLDLTSLFNNEGEVLPLDVALDFSEVEFVGGMPFQSPVQVKGSLQNRAGIVSIEARASFLYTAPCDRCATEIRREISLSIQHVLVLSLNHEDNDDFLLLESKELDLRELALADVLLSFPNKFLCSKTCKGLCMYCGKNLNEGPCDCKKPIDSRWQALQELLD